ncbi:hypothetical protein [Candidatus Formimonas warabiya]|uniref:DUF1440 domain-containing protein n=1 Tax=Formimonas warabiya TaxID=1761012 RepID=A0A3G1KQW1_FORW1|nr:hypothetical protein [Candidatus Formimonas warabiya]ATW24817.1 hypothetical protein DCMF_08545 [Candidatus Formimonas warabiya]
MRDTVLRGTIGGLIGTAGDDIIHLLGYLFFRASMTEHYISQLLFPFAEVTALRFMYSIIIHFLAGALAGVILVMIFQRFGMDYPYLKGVGFALALWTVHVAVIPNLVSLRPILLRADWEVLFDLISHGVFGFLATFYLIKGTRRIKNY